MKKSKSLIQQFRRAGSPALLAACLAAGFSAAPALAQSSTTATTDNPSVETSKTTIKEKRDGDVVVKEKRTSDDADVTVKQRTTVDQPSSTTTTTVR